MIDKTRVNGSTFEILITMSWGKGASGTERYNSAVKDAKELALAEWSRLCHAGDPRICLNDDAVVFEESVSIDDGATVYIRMVKSDRGYNNIGGVNIPGVQRRALKAAQANQ